MVGRGYLEGKTKETIGGYHLVPRALVPRTEVTPMPGVNGGGRGDVREEGGVGASLFLCAGERALRLEVEGPSPSCFMPDPKVGLGCRDRLHLVGSVSALRQPRKAVSSLPVLQGRAEGGLTVPPRKRRGEMGGKGD